MKRHITVIIVTFFSLLSACTTNPADVVIDKNGKDSSNTKITIDGKMVIHLKGDSTTVIKLLPGEHFLQVNDSSKRNFSVTEKGGILNLDNQEYVMYEITYKNSDYNGGIDFEKFRIEQNFPVSAAILVDSFVIIPKTYSAPADSTLRELLPKIFAENEQNGNADHSFNGLKKIGKGQLFIDKFWDYSMTDSLPETVEITTSKYGLSGNTATRTCILRARHFLLSVILSGKEEYYVKSLKQIREGREDKKELKEKKTKQMDF
jgi:hypothetical protein